MADHYGRRKYFEIPGIPKSINDKKLVDEVISILKEAELKVNNEFITKDICAVHRIGKEKKTTVVRVVNRNFFWQAQISGKNLKDSEH